MSKTGKTKDTEETPKKKFKVYKLAAFIVGGVVALAISIELFLQNEEADEAPKYIYVTNTVAKASKPTPPAANNPDMAMKGTNQPMPAPEPEVQVMKVRAKPQEVQFGEVLAFTQMRRVASGQPSPNQARAAAAASGPPPPGAKAGPRAPVQNMQNGATVSSLPTTISTPQATMNGQPVGVPGKFGSGTIPISAP